MQKLISTTSHNELQDDINRLIEWSKKWELKFITSKCKVMHFGNDISNSYTMPDFNDQKRKKLEFITEEKDLGVIIDHKLNFSSHIVTQVKKANKMMGLIRCSYTHLDRKSFRYLFDSLVRPHLEYCVSIWYPLLKKDEELIENVLRRATKLITGLYGKPYKERLTAINIPSKRYCRIRGDMILVYKILRGNNQSLRDLLMIIESRTRVHNFKLQKPFVQTTIRKHFLSIRAINNWNSLPDEVVNAVSLDSFKSKLHNA